METANAVGAAIKIEEGQEIKFRQDCEYAAWYTNWRVLPGVYQFKRVKKDFWNPGYEAEVDAVVTDDYYASHFGGVPFGKYNTTQNSGKRGKGRIKMSAAELLRHVAVSVDESQLDALMVEALADLKAEMKTQLSIISGTMGLEGQFPFSSNGHTEALNEAMKTASHVDSVKRRRDYIYPGGGRNTEEITPTRILTKIHASY